MEEAALAEPAATAMYAVSKAKIPAGAEVLVIGDGPIGQLAAQLAEHCRCQQGHHGRQLG